MDYSTEDSLKSITRRLHNDAHTTYLSATVQRKQLDIMGAKKVIDTYEIFRELEEAETLEEETWQHVLRTNKALLLEDRREHQRQEPSSLPKI